MARVSSFKALNIESDDESDIEIDNTKEIQIEEALKAYQTALKYHSVDKTLDQAGDAYDELFRSEIFQLPEAQSGLAKAAAYETQQDIDAYVGPLDDDILQSQPVTENAPSTLPQILHLSYKNRGEYHLDKLRVRLQQAAHDVDGTPPSIREHVLLAVNDFAEALDKDEDDKDLWRRTAKAAQTLGSERMVRYCLETALQEEEDSLEDVINLPSFEANLDTRKLQRLHERVQDEVSMQEDAQVGPDERDVPDRLQSQLEPYQFLSQSASQTVSKPVSEPETSGRILLKVQERTLDSIGSGILQHLLAQQDGSSPVRLGCAIELELPEEAPKPLDPPTRKGSEARTAPSTSDPRSREQSAATAAGDHAPLPVRESPVSSRRASTNSPSMARSELPTRKRSTDVANLPETPDGERQRSKRIRARKSAVGTGAAAEVNGADTSGGQEMKNEITLQADRWLFDLMKDVFRRMDIKMLCNADQLRKIVSPSSPALGEDTIKLGKAMQDLYAALLSWNSKKTDHFMQTKKAIASDVEQTDTGLLAFLDSSSTKSTKPLTPLSIWADVEPFTAWVNSSWMTPEQVALAWIEAVLSPIPPFADDAERAFDSRQSHYLARTWTEELKVTVRNLLMLLDAPLSRNFGHLRSRHSSCVQSRRSVLDTAEAIFELHLDTYMSMTSPTSKEQENAKISQIGRLLKWYHVVSETLGWYLDGVRANAADTGNDPSEATGALKTDPLMIRHIWASIFHLKALDEVSRDHLLACIEDMKRELGPKSKPIYLPNNSSMPEISAAAADREISKLETMDFFLSIFNEEEQHPADLIEKLEPILMPTLQAPGRSNKHKKRADNIPEDQRSEITDSSGTPEARDGNSKHELLSEFVSKATPTFRLSLWYKLRDCYESIDFPAKTLMINFRIISAIVLELQSPQYADLEAEERERTLLRWLHDIHDLLTRCYALMDSKQAGLDDFDLEQMRLSAAVLISVFTLLHTIALYDDFATASQKAPPLTNPFKAYPSESFHPASIRFHDMKLRTVIMLYRAIQEAAGHYPDRPAEQKHVDQYEFLTYVHYELGVRRICKASDNLFLIFMRNELTELAKTQPVGRDLAQVLYDLYDLNCFATSAEKEDHGCEGDYLDRETAFALVDFVLERARGTNLRDLPKVDLGKSVEKLQNALGPVKPTHATARNRKMIANYLKNPINPMELFQCLKGVSSLPTASVSPEDAPVASKGWYFLMAQINLAKHRRVRGQTPADQEDLETAVTYLGHELEYDSEQWESWHRLAYVNDCLVEESVLWSADKINSGTEELATLQRASIHSYSQAVSIALRSADDTAETKRKLGELFAEFAMRMFSSTRPPFNMQPFSTRDFPMRHFSGSNTGAGTYQRKHFQGLRTLQAYKIGFALLGRAIQLQPGCWQHRFLLGKCYWRAHVYERQKYHSSRRVLADKALECFKKTISLLPSRKEAPKSEPILEPVYKVVFVILKLVRFGTMTYIDAAKYIGEHLSEQTQFDATDVPRLEGDEPSRDQWLDFTIAVFKAMRVADKSKWHHKLHWELAQLIYEKHGMDLEAAKLTKEFMIEEKLYSVKTLGLTVWKPENERPGRHWVYMSKYARFVTVVLEKSEDLESMQLLARRVRKKSNEFYGHQALWTEVLGAYLRLHRKHYQIPDNADDPFMRNLNHEDFRPRAEAVDKWCSDPATTHPLLEVLREVNEIKKLNASLADATPVDDLLVDIYTQIYKDIGPTLPLPEKAAAGATPAANTATGTPEPQAQPQVPTPERANMMALNNLMSIDGANSDGGAAALRPSAAAATLQPDPAPRPRPRTITRINILKRAQEAAVTKLAPGPAPGAKGDKGKSGADSGGDAPPAPDTPKKTTGNGESNDASSELSDLDDSDVEGTPRKDGDVLPKKEADGDTDMTAD